MESVLNGPNQDDANSLVDYQKRWHDRSLTDDHPVRIKVKKLSRVVAYKFGNRELADDLEQNCCLALLKIKFRGKSKLDTLITTILKNLNRKEWRKAGGKRRKEIVEIVDMPDASSREVLEAVIAHVSSERLMEKLVSENSDVRATVVDTIANAETIIGRKRIAEIASARLGKKVTRHQVEVILGQLRGNLTNDGGGSGSPLPAP